MPIATLIGATALIALLIGILPGSLIATGQSTHPPVRNVTRFSWSAPAGFSGDLMIGIEVQVDRPTYCTLTQRASGAFQDDEPIAFWIRDHAEGVSISTGYIQWDRRAQAHAGGTLDSRDVTSVDGEWATHGESGGRVETRWNITIAGFGLQSRPSDSPMPSPLQLNVTCRDPFDVTGLHASRRGMSFTKQTFENGTGATIESALVVETVSYSNDDRLSDRFAQARVLFQATFERFEADMDGNLTLDHPRGSQHWILPRSGFPFVGFEGPPGGYTVGLDLLGRGEHFDVAGILVGLDPVDSLDEAVS